MWPDLHRKLMFVKLHQIEKGWEQFYVFVPDIKLFCAFDPNPLALYADVGIGKWVSYSYTIHAFSIKIFLVILPSALLQRVEVAKY